MAAGDPVHHKPPDVQHGGMVVDVQDSDLVVILPQDEEEGVHEFDELGEIVPPEDTDNLRRGGHQCFSGVSPLTCFTNIPESQVHSKAEHPTGSSNPSAAGTLVIWKVSLTTECWGWERG